MNKRVRVPDNALHAGRRRFLKGTVAAGALLGTNLSVFGTSFASSGPQDGTVTLMEPGTQQKFVNSLPIPPRIYGHPDTPITIPISATTQWMGLVDSQGEQLKTSVYGLGVAGQFTTPGPTLIARQNEILHVNWQNQLPNDRPHLLPVDTGMHIPDVNSPDGQFSAEKPVVIHLHGGHSEADSDGNPLAWYTQGYQSTGPAFVKQEYQYDNTQEAMGAWYHDHTVGMTRLNVHAGLHGMYLIKDDNEERLIENDILPSDHHMIDLSITDVLFDDQGQLYYPGWHGQPVNPITQKAIQDTWPNPSILDEFFGNFILVNGMVWPKLDVEANKYRFRLLNASSSRSYVLEFENKMPFYQLGSDGGFLDRPVRLTQLVISPAERMDVLVDFTKVAGSQIILRNRGPEIPFRGFVDPTDPENAIKLVYNEDGERPISDGHGGLAPIANPDNTGVIMRFDVAEANDAIPPQAAQFTENVTLRTPLLQIPRDDVAVVRQLIIYPQDDDLGRELNLLGTPESGSVFFMDPVTENVGLNTTEVWEVYNATASGHPIHVHQVQFEVIDRQEFDWEFTPREQPLMNTGRTFEGATIELQGVKGNPVQPQPNEQGRKDTVIALPGQVTRIIAHFDLPGEYVWHCHIITHEDYDMMRKFVVS